jgi:hypothetical protein
MRRFFGRPDRVPEVPLDPQRKAAMRRALLWAPVSYVPLLGGLAWAFFASSHWTGSRAAFLAASGVMFGAAASTALYLPVLRTLGALRRVMGMSLVRYSYISIFVAIAIAVALLVAAVVEPQG